ncbi:hypothetical protein Q4Q35_11845 [Flavivirga aquimarina]|uniref:Uncharacterized protein n=1 Tax=Flavivirga aquimarina TaxID=2027862 RepID=A0ABT8WBI8_9FLAO|nr:hypothetical protein [Flavivirga aquimarina]MDO5970499.1 hypothetical protein [Flavivirga aquimarina]
MIHTKNNNSTKLIRVYNTFLSNLKQLIDILKNLRDMLFKAEKALLISKKLSDKLNELYALLVATDISLLAMSNIPYVGAVAKVVQKVVTQIKKVVEQAKTKVNRLEQKIKPHREKVKKFGEYIDKILKPLLKIQQFITKEEQLLSATYQANDGLPASRYKDISLDKLHKTSDKLNSILAVPIGIIDKVNKLLATTQDIVKEIQKLCGLISKVIQPIIAMMDELDRVTGVLKKLSKVLTKKISIKLGFFSISMSIEKILNATGSIPGLSILTKIATKILKPILSALGLRVDSIPGLDGGVGNLGKVFGKLNVLDKLKQAITKQFATLTIQENPQGTFKNVNA